MKTSNYQFSEFMGETHYFKTEAVNGVFYKYVFNPKMKGATYANYLEIEKFEDEKSCESIMVSRKQIVHQIPSKEYTWWKLFDSGNEYTTIKHYTKEGAEWKIDRKIEEEGSIVNLEYDIKSSIIDKCLKLIENERITG